MPYNSKYIKSEIDNTLNQINKGNLNSIQINFDRVTNMNFGSSG